jgi:hypothetical protein
MVRVIVDRIEEEFAILEFSAEWDSDDGFEDFCEEFEIPIAALPEGVEEGSTLELVLAD